MSLESPLRFAPIAKATPYRQSLSTPARQTAAPAGGQSMVNVALISTTLGALSLSAFALNKVRQFPNTLEQRLAKQKNEILKDAKPSILHHLASWLGAITGITGTGMGAILLSRETVDKVARDNAADAQESVLALNNDLAAEIQGIKNSL